ncbi:MAG: DinB family protein [Anaerolineales bacterium]|nr:DinB family protein [Anaerolineales bacterium]NUQ85773.1 DinB family protein [Anaerolineales bacterium]
MNKQDIKLLFEYNQWANAKILDAAANVTGEQFLAPAPFPHGGLRGTLAHVFFAEWLWRRRMQGESPTRRIAPDEFPTFDSLRSRWLEENAELMRFVDSLTDAKLSGRFQYKTTTGVPHEDVLWQVLAHLVNHGTQHRSEAAAMLTDMGHSPGETDLIVFLRGA